MPRTSIQAVSYKKPVYVALRYYYQRFLVYQLQVLHQKRIH